MVDTAIEAFERAGFRQIVTPVFEDTSLFARTAGETSDVVSKEMYTFHDRSDRSLTLRPEGTAPVVRAYIEHGLAREPQPVRLWYFAPMYRYAAPQAGRYREHWQFGVEAIGSDDPAVDAEVIAVQAAWYRSLGLGALELHLNSIGDPACRPDYRAALVAYLEPLRDRLSPESQERLERNPMRILDSKDERDQALIADAPRISQFLCEACRAHFDEVRAHLTARGVDHVVDDALVRGLDYYTRTAWEFIPVADGRAQATISGGGRYDGLAEQIGGKRTPGVGFGCGVERVVLALESAGARAGPARVRLVLRRRCAGGASHRRRPARRGAGQRSRRRDGSRRTQPEGAAPSRAAARSPGRRALSAPRSGSAGWRALAMTRYRSRGSSPPSSSC